jgi:hypothetical protein
MLVIVQLLWKPTRVFTGSRTADFLTAFGFAFHTVTLEVCSLEPATES